MSFSEVIRTSVCLPQRDKALETEKLAILRRAIAIGLADVAEGRFSCKSVKNIAEEVRWEYLGK